MLVAGLKDAGADPAALLDLLGTVAAINARLDAVHALQGQELPARPLCLFVGTPWGCQVPHGACLVILFQLSVRAESGRRSPGNRGEGPLAGPGAVLNVGDYFKGSEPGS